MIMHRYFPGVGGSERESYAFSSRRSLVVAVGCVLVMAGVLLVSALSAAAPSVELNGHRVYTHARHLTVGKLLALAHITVGPGVMLAAAHPPSHPRPYGTPGVPGRRQGGQRVGDRGAG